MLAHASFRPCEVSDLFTTAKLDQTHAAPGNRRNLQRRATLARFAAPALSTELQALMLDLTGFEPATRSLPSEVTDLFTTGATIGFVGERVSTA